MTKTNAPEGVPVAFGAPSERGAVVLFVVRRKAARDFLRDALERKAA